MSTENIPSPEEFSCFIAEHCPKVKERIPNLWDKLEARNWRDRKFLPIKNWKLYAQGLEERMEH